MDGWLIDVWVDGERMDVWVGECMCGYMDRELVDGWSSWQVNKWVHGSVDDG